MKKAMVALFGVFAAAFTVGFCTHLVRDALADSCSACGCCDFVQWSSTNPTSTNADEDGGFGFYQVLLWGYQNPANQGTVIEPGTSTNIGSVTFNPNLFFPDEDCCSGDLSIHTTGHLSNSSINGTLKSKGQIVYPFHANTSTVTVNHF